MDSLFSSMLIITSFSAVSPESINLSCCLNLTWLRIDIGPTYHDMGKLLEKMLSDIVPAPRKSRHLILHLGLWEDAFFPAVKRGVELLKQLDTPLSTYAYALHIRIWASHPYTDIDVAPSRGRRLNSNEQNMLQGMLPKTFKVASIEF